MKAEVRTKRFIVCPHCGEGEATIEHLFEDGIVKGTARTAGPWYCEECGKAFSPVIHADGSVEVEKDEQFLEKTYDLMVLKPQDKPMYFVLNGKWHHFREGFGKPLKVETPDEEANSKKFLYESHSCPTNWLRDLALVAFDGDLDPHGVIEFVRFVKVSDVPPQDEWTLAHVGEDWESIFPEVNRSEP